MSANTELRESPSSSREAIFPLVARAWSLVFLVVGLSFLFAPTAVGQALSALGALFGLGGTITAPSGTLWWVLSLSLMSAVTLLADACARHPELFTPYAILLTAKIVSTLGFTGLAAVHGPAWLLCALGDGFVALTLFLARRARRGAMVEGMQQYYSGKGPHYEVWYGKLDLGPERAFWFRYTLLDGATREASTWAILFEDGKVHAHRDRFPLSDLAPAGSVIAPASEERFRGRPQVFHLGGAHLDTRNALGTAGPIRWNLHWRDSGRRFVHAPRLLRHLRIAKTSYSTCLLDLRVSGRITAGDREIELDGVRGMIGHLEGKKSGHAWAWAHANSFEGEEDVVFEGLSAQIALGGKISPPITSFVLYLGDRRYTFDSPAGRLKASSSFGDGRWEFSASRGGITLRGEAIAPEEVALVEYTDTDDSKLWCANSKLAKLVVHLSDPASGIERTFTAERTAAFEIVTRDPPKRGVDLG